MISNQNTQLSQNGVYVHRKAYENSLPIPKSLFRCICCLLGFHCPSAFLQTGSQLLDHKSPLPMDFFTERTTQLSIKDLSYTFSAPGRWRHYQLQTLCAVRTKSPDTGLVSRCPCSLTPGAALLFLWILSLVLDLSYLTRRHLRVHWKECFLKSSADFQSAISGLYFKKTVFCWMLLGLRQPGCVVGICSPGSLMNTGVCVRWNLQFMGLPPSSPNEINLLNMRPGPSSGFSACCSLSLASLQPGCLLRTALLSPTLPRGACMTTPFKPLLLQSHLKAKQNTCPVKIYIIRYTKEPFLQPVTYGFPNARQPSSHSDIWHHLLSDPGSATTLCFTLDLVITESTLGLKSSQIAWF